MNELVHYGVRGMKWGHRKLSKLASKHDSLNRRYEKISTANIKKGYKNAKAKSKLLKKASRYRRRSKAEKYNAAMKKVEKIDIDDAKRKYKELKIQKKLLENEKMQQKLKQLI